MSKLDDLQELLKKLPGIGPRQARRFVYFLLSAPDSYIHRITSLLNDMRNEKKICSFCRRLHFEVTKHSLCNICSDTTRDLDRVLVIEKNSDLENFERSGVWNGRYFLILQNIKINEQNPESRLGLETLTNGMNDGSISEIVSALSVNPDGEYTTELIHTMLSAQKPEGVSITTLARGLSTGSEIEYADEHTLKNALENRK